MFADNLIETYPCEVHTLPSWEERAAIACVPLVISRTPATGVLGAIAHASLGDTSLSRITANGHVADHDRNSVSRTDGDFLLACVQINGNGELMQDDRREPVGPYDIVFFDSSRPFRWSFPSSFDQIVLRFPRASLSRRLPVDANLVARSISGRSGVGRLAAEYVCSLIRQREHLADTAIGQQVSESAADLLGYAATEHFRTALGPETNLLELHLHRALQLMKRELHDYDLCPESIASAIGVSVRYLHRVFASRKRTVVRSLIDVRLEQSASWLVDPRFAHKSIEHIAAACGFKNASHFSRLFRNRYTISPRDYRARQRMNYDRY
ncbi:AraC-like ligand-binding domain-containing protein [Paraburkholderia tropica]|uniref:AraC-like ligand-binding domain-containing protein n=1 Tax=Paraburkholderia tropica TaxID=92647 RepID=UPI002AB671EF|nr:helix-turn-helix domain-containing protein [Paraburkholderia tropica]